MQVLLYKNKQEKKGSAGAQNKAKCVGVIRNITDSNPNHSVGLYASFCALLFPKLNTLSSQVSLGPERTR